VAAGVNQATITIPSYTLVKEKEVSLPPVRRVSFDDQGKLWAGDTTGRVFEVQ